MSAAASAAENSGPSAFSEKAFYLEEFYGKSILFALVPPCGERLSDLDSLIKTLRELRRNQTRSIVITSDNGLERVLRRMGRLKPAETPPVFDSARGLRSRPYPPDSAVTQIWRVLRSGSIAVAAAKSRDPEDLLVFAQEMASRLRVFKLVMIDRRGGLLDKKGERISFVDVRRVIRVARRETSRVRRAALKAVKRALEDEVGSVNLTAPREIYDELFSYIGTGTLFTSSPYGSTRPISIDDFEEAESLILRGQQQGLLLLRSREEIAQILPSCFGYRIGDEHLAGIPACRKTSMRALRWCKRKRN